ncbi:hypothetical protein ACFFV7_20560 [Nonomuraea spiralis]|uniref:Uncharacterized protein n=1 Tax=Nonomuraea spiralis TaxID=46182 RepID=A0ABV5IGE0_9ACTN|nr:hypothetical protein [Nonomuraea spiralis]GGS99119.1 hypothetical protein GCM10010176_048910 [Nonomuraea spiralis]
MGNVRTPAAALALVVLYGGLRVYWELGHMPERMSPVGSDLIVFTGWGAVALCAAAASLLVVMTAVMTTSGRPAGPLRWAPPALAWAVGGALVVSGALLLLDVVAVVVPGLGVPFSWTGALSKAACVGSGVLLWRTAGAYRRRVEGACGACGRRSSRALARTPGWAFAAAYVSVAGCLGRVAAQAAVGFEMVPYRAGAVMFEVEFLLAGTLLPLALVHRFGRVWPGWVPWLAGRRVPRPLVLWPGVAVSGGLLAYFGVGLGQMVAERLGGGVPFSGGDLPEAFFWVAVPGYVVWGAGMAVAAWSYARRTRIACEICGR